MACARNAFPLTRRFAFGVRRLAFVLYVVACRKGVSTQLEAPSRNCTRLSGLKVLVGNLGAVERIGHESGAASSFPSSHLTAKTASAVLTTTDV